MNTTLLPGLFTALIFSFFFSGIEIAFLSANKLHIELKKQEGSLAGKIISYFTNRPSWFIATTMVGNTLAIVVGGLLATHFFADVLFLHLPDAVNHTIVVLILCILFTTSIILFSTEFLSKNLFLINPNQILHTLAIPILITFIILFPITAFVIYVSRMVTYILRVEYSEVKPVFGLTDLTNYLGSRDSVKHEDENITLNTTIFHNAIEFKTVRVRECMIPRTDIIAINVDEGIERLREVFVESEHSKIIVYRETIDDVIGYCHSAALFKKPQRIEDILTPIIMVPETTLANELMIRFISQQKSLALVVDEFGGTSGLVSMEDVIEKIFGEIEDEHDADDLVEQKIDDSNYVLSARLEIYYVNQTYEWSLPTGNYETLAGLILSLTEKIPQVGEVVELDQYRFTILSTEDNRIDTVKVTVKFS